MGVVAVVQVREAGGIKLKEVSVRIALYLWQPFQAGLLHGTRVLPCVAPAFGQHSVSLLRKAESVFQTLSALL